MLKILTVPEATEILRTKSEPIEKLDAELLAFLKELGDTLRGQKDPAGVGLSAIQVGRPIRAFATFLPIEKDAGSKGPTFQGRTLEGRTLSKTKPKLTFYVNPEIVEHAEGMTLGEELNQRTKDEGRRTKENGGIQRPATSDQRPFLEGCLSIPRIYGAVLRWPWIKVKYQILSGVEVSDPLQGLQARVFQHELDHLNGILFTDHVLAQGNKLYRDLGDGPEQINL